MAQSIEVSRDPGAWNWTINVRLFKEFRTISPELPFVHPYLSLYHYKANLYMNRLKCTPAKVLYGWKLLRECKYQGRGGRGGWTNNPGHLVLTLCITGREEEGVRGHGVREIVIWCDSKCWINNRVRKWQREVRTDDSANRAAGDG